LDAHCDRAKPACVLDLGCGIGRLTIPISQRRLNWTLHGVDISWNMIELAYKLDAHIQWSTCNGRTLPYDEAAFDAVYSMITLQHLPREAQRGYIHEVARVLLPGGVFRFQVLEGTAESFMWNELDEAYLHASCAATGLKITALNRVAPLSGGDAKVLWVTAVKRDATPPAAEELTPAEVPSKKPKAATKKDVKKTTTKRGRKS